MLVYSWTISFIKSNECQPLYLRMIAIDEAHKIFDRMPTFRLAFDELQQLKELSCPI